MCQFDVHSPRMRKEDRMRQFVNAIWKWYVRHKRTLPWRDLKIPDDMQRAYVILVSEVMLQQTQVPRVVPIFRQFLEKFPTIADLARASNRDVLLAWRGMGYNRRALQLRDAARHITGCAGNSTNNSAPVRQSPFPKEMRELLQIPGVGPYTAAAIRNFAFELPTPCLDTNIRRVLHLSFIGQPKRDGAWKKDDRYLLRLAGEVLNVALEKGSTADWHAALMDYGALALKRPPVRLNNPATQQPSNSHREPGRIIAGRFVPNRIIRGKIVDLLRDHPQGLMLARIGREMCDDWSQEHRPWLRDIMAKLQREKFVEERRKKYMLPERTA